MRGWDRQETIFTETLEGIDVDLGEEPRPPEGFEVVVSTAHRDRIEGTPRAAFLAELVAAQPSIVVTGAHGKTTTTAMIAYALRETGNDPAWIVGGVVPQLGGNAGGGSGWLVVEGDESDRSVFALRPALAVVTNVELDHHAAYGSEAELRDVARRVARARPRGRPRLGARAGRRSRSRSPASTTGANAAAAQEALVRVGVDARGPKRRWRRSPAPTVASRSSATRGGVTVVDDYGHNPTELRAALDTARGRTEGRLVALYVPHVVERTRHLHRELGDALGLADVAIVTDFVGRRDAPARRVSPAGSCSRRSPTRPGVSGRRRSKTPRASRSTSSGRETSS